MRLPSSLVAVSMVVCLPTLAVSIAAQDQRGSIQGRIENSAPAPLPGVTVVVRSPTLVAAETAVSDELGFYRFPALPPGLYQVVATLKGFSAARRDGIRLELGQILKLDFVLAVDGVTEAVVVHADVALIDVKQNAAGINLQADLIERIPKGRSYESLVTSAPGITNEARNFGIQIDGASGADNRFVIDGVDTTNLRFGTSGKGLAPDFIQEVQARASGYNAEYRAALGGVISAITKTGSNHWSGSAGLYFTSDNLQGEVRPFLRLNPSDQTVAEYAKSPPDDFIAPEMVFDLGGPIRQDRLWFYVAYDPQFTRTRRTVRFTASNPNQVSSTFESEPSQRTLNYNITAQLRPNLRAKVAGWNERARGGATLPNIQPDGTSTSNPTLFPSQTRVDSFNDSYSGVFDWIAGDRTYVNVTTSVLTYGFHDVGDFSNALGHVFVGSNFQFPEIPTALQQQNGYSDAPSSSRLVKDDFSRFQFNADVTRYVNWRSQHTLKAGLQYERMANQVIRGAQAPIIDLFWDSSLRTNDGRIVRGTYGYYDVTRGVISDGDVHANNVGLFVQDAWTFNNKLTLNLGIRTESEDVPSYRPENPGVHFGFADKIAPRVGAAYDLFGDSRWKIYGSWGVFYDLMKLTIGRVMFGADRWESYRFTLDSYDWPTIQCSYPPVAGPACPGTFIEAADFRPVSNQADRNLVDPWLNPARSQELTLGFDHALTNTMQIGVRYAHKWVDRAIEAVGHFVNGTAEEYWVANPGYGYGEFPLGRAFPAQPKAERVYDGLEFRVRKRLANRWSLESSYLFSRLWGNWSGIGTSDEAVGGLQPNSGRIFDFLYYSYSTAAETTLGRLGTDRPHQFKLQATYDLPWGTMVGGNLLAESGIPNSTIAVQKVIGFFPFGRGDLGRTPALSQVDLLAQQQFTLKGRSRLLIGVNVLNVFDSDTVTRYSTTPYRDSFNLEDARFFAGFDLDAEAARLKLRPDARFRLPSGFQDRRSIRLQMKITY